VSGLRFLPRSFRANRGRDSVIIGPVTFCVSMAGLFAGNKLGQKFGKRMEIIGGLVLPGIGFRVLITHLF
jgi:manganese efflux pump family protein